MRPAMSLPELVLLDALEPLKEVLERGKSTFVEHSPKMTIKSDTLFAGADPHLKR